MDWQQFLASGVIAAIVAGFVSRRNSERSIQVENITRERAKWRDKIRSMASSLRQAVAAKDASKLRDLRLDLSLNLNPLDDEDLRILAVISQLEDPNEADKKLEELHNRIALLLKHDWDRAKREAKPWPFRRAAKRHHYRHSSVR